MNKQEFDQIVKDSVAAGNTKAAAEAHVIAGYHIPTDSKGSPVFEKAIGDAASVAKPKHSRKKAAK